MWWQLVQKLFNPVFLSGAVHIRDLVLRQASKVKLDLWGQHRMDAINTQKEGLSGRVFISPSFGGGSAPLQLMRGPAEPTQQQFKPASASIN